MLAWSVMDVLYPEGPRKFIVAHQPGQWTVWKCSHPRPDLPPMLFSPSYHSEESWEAWMEELKIQRIRVRRSTI